MINVNLKIKRKYITEDKFIFLELEKDSAIEIFDKTNIDLFTYYPEENIKALIRTKALLIEAFKYNIPVVIEGYTRIEELIK